MATTAPSRPTTGANRARPVAPEIFGPMRSLTRRIQAMLPAGQAQGHVVGVTSCTRHEGVSSVAENLAICAAALSPGRVLLVDANLQSASVAKRFGVKQTIGLCDCLTGESSVQECLAGTAHANLFVLPAGTDRLRSQRIANERRAVLFGDLRRDFELIVVDLPHVGEMDEMILASRLVDGFLLVLESERIHRQVAQHAVRQLEQIDARLLGVVLNKRKNHIPGWLYRRL